MTREEIMANNKLIAEFMYGAPEMHILSIRHGEEPMWKK